MMQCHMSNFTCNSIQTQGFALHGAQSAPVATDTSPSRDQGVLEALVNAPANTAIALRTAEQCQSDGVPDIQHAHAGVAPDPPPAAAMEVEPADPIGQATATASMVTISEQTLMQQAMPTPTIDQGEGGTGVISCQQYSACVYSSLTGHSDLTTPISRSIHSTRTHQILQLRKCKRYDFVAIGPALC